ncbi:MAG: Threonylcarbamoyl-AMP synthase [Deltaproteobacteria bacterium ADurb.Bin510]|nr:MAG: Threonylcarbamoyl-AMP synthase [Deltaproteobacteria bacterium ADurb.Bin510]
MRFAIDPQRPKPRIVSQVAEILKNDGIIVYPTDTVYGLGCLISNKHGIERIQAIKRSRKPMSIILPDLKTISEYAQVDNTAFKLIRQLTPGPYTFVLPATRLVPKLLQDNRKTIGVRVPDHWFCQDLLNAVNEPIITTSMPHEDESVYSDPLTIESDFGHAVDAVVDCGILGDSPSTVLSFEEGSPTLIRQGLGPVDFLD